MKKYVFFLILMVAILLVFTACNGNNDAEISETEQPQVVANTASGQSAGSHQQAETNFTDINDFWAHYRQAVVNQDFERLATMTNFPLRSLGMFYTDPIVYIDRNEFESAFARFLAQEQTVTHIYEDGEITDSIRTNFEFIVQNENLAFLSDDERGALHINDRQNSGSIEGSWARAYDEIFEIVDGV